MSCNVCVEPFNRSNRAVITCPQCDFESCRECSERYLCSSNEEAHCMNCKSDWDYRTLNNLFTKSFIQKKYKKHIENILFDRERAMLPATQPFVEDQIRKEAIKKEIKYVNDQISLLGKRLKRLKLQLYSNSVEHETFIKKCPVQNCRGFLNADWKCGMCNQRTCRDCHDILPKDAKSHTCNPENVETAKLLLRDTRGCPKCATPIFKIDGCDQMFCTQCHTAFSWNTGRIQNGVIHNPHYIEMQEQGGSQQRNLLEVRCGREFDNDILNALYQLTMNENNRMFEVSHYCNFIRRHYLPKYVNDVVNDNFDLRVKYLRSEITEESFKLTLQKRNKTNSKNHEIAHILNMYTNSVIEIVYRYIYHLQTITNLAFADIHKIERTYLSEIDQMIVYTNSCFGDIAKIYNGKLHKINASGNLYKI